MFRTTVQALARRALPRATSSTTAPWTAIRAQVPRPVQPAVPSWPASLRVFSTEINAAAKPAAAPTAAAEPTVPSTQDPKYMEASAEEAVVLESDDAVVLETVDALDEAAASEPRTDLEWFVDPLPENLTPLWMKNLQQMQAQQQQLDDVAGVPIDVDATTAPTRTSSAITEFSETVHVTDLARFLEEQDASDVVILDVAARCDVADAFVLCTARHTNHMRAIMDRLVHALKHSSEAARKAGLTAEGADSTDWMLVDLGRVMVHVFTPEGRETYNLDKLWTQSIEETENEVAAFLEADEEGPAPVAEFESVERESSESPLIKLTL
ncbi:iojap-like ribosome-associated protein [Allomyces macrogynus ATCC 38327]|uniref:Iojap-like ribosome-associated protein n=1 Tax=Allomyces macrogynus (strain ATCC 38327) TaxID=578462 RepID=A0A0L0SFH3_ALLM3|nr:iojap-like ribosome-associated protein [Allomyces macrogynus ATCC 38327]|eukprot:KNE61120.1 iojap-like ribosome-associated protein [Allomyces macrogynus ATCC 38327]